MDHLKVSVRDVLILRNNYNNMNINKTSQKTFRNTENTILMITFVYL
jgi:hypothetical protein